MLAQGLTCLFNRAGKLACETDCEFGFGLVLDRLPQFGDLLIQQVREYVAVEKGGEGRGQLLEDIHDIVQCLF